MKSVNPVKMLSALALVLLVFSATEGRILSRCELKKQLDAAQFQAITAMGEKISASHLIARLVCKANSSAFNTSFVKAIIVNDKKNPAQAPAGVTPRGRPQAPAGVTPHASAGVTPHASAGVTPHASAGVTPHASAGVTPHASAGVTPHASAGGPPHAPAGVTPQGRPQAPAGGQSQAPAVVPLKPHTQAPTKGPHGSGHEATHPQLNATAKVVGQLYGMFQLSDQLACDSGMMPSPNVCNMSCTALIDDDITDDIACLKTLINSMKPKPKGKPIDVVKIFETLMEKKCRSVVPSKYFADCA